MKNALLALTLAAATLPVVPGLIGAADARPHYGRYDHRIYDSRGAYRAPRRMGRNDYVWRGGDGRYYCRRGNGTTGLIVGAAAGGILGNVVDGGRDRTLGTLLGAAGGALLGRSIDRGNVRCR